MNSSRTVHTQLAPVCDGLWSALPVAADGVGPACCVGLERRTADASQASRLQDCLNQHTNMHNDLLARRQIRLGSRALAVLRARAANSEIERCLASRNKPRRWLRGSLGAAPRSRAMALLDVVESHVDGCAGAARGHERGEPGARRRVHYDAGTTRGRSRGCQLKHER